MKPIAFRFTFIFLLTAIIGFAITSTKGLTAEKERIYSKVPADNFLEKQLEPFIEEILAGGVATIRQACQLVYLQTRAKCEIWPESPSCPEMYEKLVDHCVQSLIGRQSTGDADLASREMIE